MFEHDKNNDIPVNSVAVIIAAGGSSSRMGGLDKQFLPIGGVPVILRSVKAFLDLPCVAEIIIVLSAQNIPKMGELLKNLPSAKRIRLTEGGGDRFQSVARGIAAVTCGAELVAVHDGARPFVSREEILRVVALAQKTGAAITAVRVKDTVKEAEEGGVISTPERSRLFLAQTPQVFSLKAYREILSGGITGDFSDDSSVFEAAGIPVAITEGSYDNIKITTREDLILAEALLKGEDKKNYTNIRIGTGYDVHRLVPGRRLILGGAEIPYSEGLLGHSDADVLTHAVMDALLGAAALGDIGKIFPDTDESFRDADSICLLRQVIGLLFEKGFVVGNIDAVIIAERPRIGGHTELMRQILADACRTDISSISVKATTEEGLGLEGKGIGAKAVAVIAVRE